ncbi:MAG: sugar ABC transporter permease, partial [Kutzneria sp.]|nr:sugar ABC transporter permease [Kutzneria sp.]
MLTVRGASRAVNHFGGLRMSWFVAPAVVFLGLFSVYPLIALVQMALSEVRPENLFGGWHWVGLDNFGSVLASVEFWQSVRVTVYFTAVVLTVNLVLGFLVGSALSAGTADATLTQAVMVFVWALPILVVGNIWRILLADTGLVNTLLGVVGIPGVGWLSSPDLAVWIVALVVCWSTLPFNVMMFRAALLGIPRDLLEAAAIDGASVRQIRWRLI